MLRNKECYNTQDGDDTGKNTKMVDDESRGTLYVLRDKVMQTSIQDERAEEMNPRSPSPT